MLAWVYFYKKEFTDAIETADKAIILNSKSTNSYLCKGYSLICKKKLDKAVLVFEEALKNDPNNQNLIKGKEYATQMIRELRGSRRIDKSLTRWVFDTTVENYPFDTVFYPGEKIPD